MKRYSAGKASYHKMLDIMYVGINDAHLDICDKIEDTPSGIIVMYDNNGAFAGAEIPLFSKRFGNLPAVVSVDASDPFELTINEACVFPG